MKNAAQIRKDNKMTIYHFMLDGKLYTKQQVSIGTGLSVATCNTLLNDMEMQKIVTGGNRKIGEIGRSSVLYQINEEHEYYLALHFYKNKEKCRVEYVLFSATGNFLEKNTTEYEAIDYERIEHIIEVLIAKYPNITQIIIGTPSIAEYGIIRHCDIPELEGVPMQEKLEKKFSISVSMENDMHYKAYGYFIKTHNQNDIISLGAFPSHLLPGTATIYKGTIIKGTNGFAGMTGFLAYGVSKEEQLALLEPDTCMPFIAKSICSIIVLLNPTKIVLTGDLINESALEKIIEICKKDIPSEYMPDFEIIENFDEYYYAGMYQIALEKKEF